ncbi:FtsX-like permease family protein [Mucilaginibacter limnophilus]|uniref:FtsX-like permease family protein n=1 Tax=Mucilaginibacter limnophilus TaxID=1932778 RepID=A0A3S2Y5T3_9SPHI|nr:ABC transporter permease [Mucilaginibacter limnophilus]RVU02746.1 FtsX-like permease family protein [Mucilaginibacter limnophilus]
MIKNYFKTAYRSLKKNKGFTIINLLGLALGLTIFMLISLYVYDELRYDRYNEKAGRIYRFNSDLKFGGNTGSYAVSPAPLAAAVRADLPEVESTVRFRMWGGAQVKKGNMNIHEHAVVFADSTLFKVFTLPMLYGNPATALKEPNTVVITEKMAGKYFGKVNVVGQTLTLNNNELYKVTGVIKDVPRQSHFDFDFYLSMSGFEDSRNESWFSNNYNTYVLLKKTADVKQFEAKLPEFLRKQAGSQLQSILHLTFDKFEQAGNYFKLTLIPLTDIHLKSSRVAELSANGSMEYVYIFSAIAVFILLIACVNFMNLSTARSSNRAREVGVRKVLGSSRNNLIIQYLTESVLITFIGAVIALIGARLLLPLFNQLAGKEMVITPQLLIGALPLVMAFSIVLGCLAGAYPALFLSGFKPVQVLKGKLAVGMKGGTLRNFLVVFQFAISVFLIIGTLVIYNQLQYIQNRNLGYNRDQVMIVQNVWMLDKQLPSFKQEIKQLPGVNNATLTGYVPMSGYGNSTTVFKDPVIDEKRSMMTQKWMVDEDYVNTLGIKMAAGRFFSKDMPTDSSAVVINEAAAKMLNFDKPLNSMIYSPQDDMVTSVKGYRIIGIMKDFNFTSLRENISPLVLILEQDGGGLCIRTQTKNISATIAQIENVWKKFSPNQEFSYSFMDENFDSFYRAEQRTGKLFIIFTIMAILIACLGLFGLTAYSTEQRIKEIGIRKILGAHVSGIVGMLSKDFLKPVLVAILIAVPLAWYFMQKWLQGFAYRQDIQWWVVALAALTAIIIAFVTTSFQAVKAALANPVKSLRSE